MVPELAPVSSWTGFYLGAGGGVGWADIDINHRQGRGTGIENRVRQPQATPCGTDLLHGVPPTPAHPLKSLVAQLNRNWRVMDDPLQWILQRRKGNPRKKNSGWGSRSFCRTREGLLRCVREHCGEVAKDALAQLQALPDYHPDWEPLEIAGRTRRKLFSDPAVARFLDGSPGRLLIWGDRFPSGKRFHRIYFPRALESGGE